MKNKRRINGAALFFLIGWLLPSAFAQEGNVWFSNGVAVSIKSDHDKNFGYANIYKSSGTDKNIVQRVLIDRKNKTYFGYDLEIAANGDAAAARFEVWIKPLSADDDIRKAVAAISKSQDLAERSLPKYPDKFVVQVGDTIRLDVLENPQTKETISDVIKITRGAQKPDARVSDAKEPKDFTVGDVQMSLVGFEAYVNGEKVKWRGGGMSGAVLWIYFPNKGRFIFSPIEQTNPAFQKIGRIDGSAIHFNHDGADYKFVSNAPVLGAGGKWNLWVMFDADYRPAANEPGANPFVFGAANKVEYLFDNR